MLRSQGKLLDRSAPGLRCTPLFQPCLTPVPCLGRPVSLLVAMADQGTHAVSGRDSVIPAAPPVPDYPIGTSPSAGLERPAIGFKHPFRHPFEHPYVSDSRKCASRAPGRVGAGLVATESVHDLCSAA